MDLPLGTLRVNSQAEGGGFVIGRERLVIYLVGLFLGVAAFGYSYLRYGAGPPPAEPQNRLETVIQEGAELVLRHVAGQEVAWSEVVPVEPELIGLTLAELRGIRPQWSVQSFSPNRLVVDVPCQVQGSGGFVGEREGRLAIFSGTPAGCYELQQLTDIMVEDLAPEARQAVQSFIVYDDPGDLPQILDGLTSTQW